MSHWIFPQPWQHWPAASIARVSCFSLFSQVTYLHFAYAIRGRQFDSERGGGGWHCGNEYSDLQNAENNLSSYCGENKYFNGGRSGGSANFSQNFWLASPATVQFSNNFSGFARNSKTIVLLSFYEYLHIQCINRYTCISLCTVHLHSNIYVSKWATCPLAVA